MGIRLFASAHHLRHWFGTMAYAERRDLRAVQDAVGHGSPAQTARYIRVARGAGEGVSLDVDRAAHSNDQHQQPPKEG